VPTPPLNLVNAGRLIAHLDQSWDRRRSMKALLAKSVPALQGRSLETQKILMKLLTGQQTPSAIAKAA
jgi:hypothetical protein